MKKIGVAKTSASGVHALDGFAAKLGTPKNMSGKPCSLCGGAGHKSSDHAGGKAVIDSKEDSEDDGKGPAKDMDKATQFGRTGPPSKYATGSPNYQAPGSEGGMS